MAGAGACIKDQRETHGYLCSGMFTMTTTVFGPPTQNNKSLGFNWTMDLSVFGYITQGIILFPSVIGCNLKCLVCDVGLVELCYWGEHE